MIGPHVVFRLADGATARVTAGGILGRTSAASLRLLDPRVSEAHALVSLRGRELRLLALRGRVQVDDEDVAEVVLLPGQRVVLGSAVALVVEATVLGEHVAAMEFSGEVRELCAGVYSFVAGPPPDLVPRFVPEARAWVWSTDDGWMVRAGTGEPQRWAPGRAWTIAGVQVRAVAVEAPSGAGPTADLPRPLRLVCRTTTVHVHRPPRAPLAVDARAGQLLSELALMATPVPWATAAQLLWPGETDGRRLRHNLDAVIARLRARLREGGVREDLVRTDRRGNLEVFLHPGDEVVDEA